jgi:hypothetical protein
MEVCTVKKKHYVVWLVLIVAFFALTAGGCGGSSSSSYSSETDSSTTTEPDPIVPDPNVPDTERLDPEIPLEPATEEEIENIEEAFEILEESAESVFVENGEEVESLDFDTYVERTVSFFEGQPDVSNVTFHQGDSILDSKIDVTLESGLVQTIVFYDETTRPPLELDVDESELSRGTSAPRGIVNPNKDVNVLVLDYVADDNFEAFLAAKIKKSEFKDQINVDYWNLGTFRSSLAPLRALYGYKYIVIGAHAADMNGDMFIIPLNTSIYGNSLSMADLADIAYGRVGLGSAVPINPESLSLSKPYTYMFVKSEFFKYYYNDRGGDAGGLYHLYGYPIFFFNTCYSVKGDLEGLNPIADALAGDFGVGAGAVLGFDGEVMSPFGIVNAYGIFEKLMEPGLVISSAINTVKARYGKTDKEVDSYADDLRSYLAGYMSTQQITNLIASLEFWTFFHTGAELQRNGDPGAQFGLEKPDSGSQGDGEWEATSGSGHGNIMGVPITATLNYYRTSLNFITQVENTALVEYGPTEYSFNVTGGGRSETIALEFPKMTRPVVQIGPNIYMWETSNESITITIVSDTKAEISGIYTESDGELNYNLTVEKK